MLGLKNNTSDSHRNGSGYHLLPYFISNINIDTYTFEYEYKTGISHSDFYLDIYSIQLKVDIVKFNIHE